MRALLDALHPWPLEEALLRPLATLLLAFLVPIASARVLAMFLLSKGESKGEAAVDPHARAVRVAPFRSACFVVGLVQLELAWMLGSTALGPAWIHTPRSGWSEIFGALTTVVAFVGGGIGRLVEREHVGGAIDRTTLRDVIALRLRMGAYLLGPLAIVHLATRLPLVQDDGALRWGLVALAIVIVVLGVAYGGLGALVLTGAVRRPSPRIVALARRAASREGVWLASVWRLPTGSVPFANAAAIPWARTMVVTDRITELLEEEELDAVLAHEAGHLSEAPWVALARVGAASLLIAGLSLGPTVLWALGVSDEVQLLCLVTLLLAGVGILIAVVRLARRMEERADAHARDHVGSEQLARALEKIHHDALAPMVTGRKRVHPDLYDRLASCGRTQGERPTPPRTRPGLLVGLGVASVLLVSAWLAYDLTRLPASEAELAGEGETWRRLRVDPWDGGATLALAWQARRREDLERA
ncbi:MAG: M48 family metalloprotease, partial [Deltaproteobacteria bacterium]|nr:M48 family metalloprotease [Deltaproteobacteria bacterium]